MPHIRKVRLSQFVAIAVFAIGAMLIVASAFYSSSFLAILSVTIFFWATILLYINPSKHVPLTLLNASTISSAKNTERVLSEANLTEKGRYLPPKYLNTLESSLVFIPKKSNQPTEKPEGETNDVLYSPKRNGMFLTPPGESLSRLFEKQLGVLFTKTDLTYLKKKLPKLLTDQLDLAEDARMQSVDEFLTLEVTGSIFNELCQETKEMTRTHTSLGCLLSSAIACALAKSTGKVIIIKNEEQTPDGKTTKIEYQIMGD